MGGDARTAYAVLGLEPGADREAIDEAYRRLIKLYHPDRSGGDAQRAAELNRAYFELRRASDPERHAADRDRVPPESVAEAIYKRRAERSRRAVRHQPRRRFWPLALLGAAILLFAERERLRATALALYEEVVPPWSPVLGGAPHSTSARGAGDIEAALAEPEIADSVRLARRLAAAPEERRAGVSRDCHREMRARPTTDRLDRCAAFDYAAAMLQDRDPVAEGGPFGASAVTARQMAAASLLTDDYWAIEARLDQVRARVELALAPPPPPPVRLPLSAEPEAVSSDDSHAPP